MSSRRASLLLFASLCGVSPGPATAETSIQVTLDPEHLLVGDRVTATLTLPLPDDGASPTFPDWSNGWGEAEVLEAGAVTVEGEGEARVASQRLTLTAFRTGKVELPPVVVRVGEDRELRTPAALALEVRSVLAADDADLDPAPPAPPRALPVPRAVWYALAVALALTALAGMLAYRRRYGSDPLAAPALAPFAELERALGLLGERTPDEAFRGLSHAFRRYLGRAFGFPALESSSTEIHRRLAERGVARDVVQRATATLRLADQVKFARRPARADEVASRIDESRALGREIEGLLSPAPTPVVDGERTVA
jgi:hypothetical protein